MHSDILNKVHKLDSLKRQVEVWKAGQEKVVFTNGCFDILHRGHVDYLAQASLLGDNLIVGINSDESVKALGKGEERPLQDENSRAYIIASLFYVDAVIIFNEDTPYELISEIVPDILVKGGDWKEEDIVGGDIVKKNGGIVKNILFLEGFSTTGVIEKIRPSEK